MIHGLPADKWQEIGWNGLCMNIPASWQPTAVYPEYLFFELDGKPALEVKWQTIHGRFSASRILSQLKESLKAGARLESWGIPRDFQELLTGYTVAGFQMLHDNDRNQGLVLFCPECSRVTLLQWYFDTAAALPLLVRLFGSFRDHGNGQERLWAMYDIRFLLPGTAHLRSHEFLPGRYTLCFDLDKMTVTLYRFKPASVLLKNKSIGEFGQELIKCRPLEERQGWASWSSRAKGLELLMAKARRKPVWRWMRCWHDQDHNVILGVKAEGKPRTETGLLDRICSNYIALDTK